MNWHELAEAIRPYHEIITALSTVVIAVLTIVLAYVAWRQIRDARILQRAYLDAEFGGIRNNTAGDLVGHVIFKNVGHLPAQKLYWLVRLNSGDSGWSPPKIKILQGESVIPIGSSWPVGSSPLVQPQEDPKGLFLYVWGRAEYKDGFRWRKRRTDFCHRYPWEMRGTPTGGGVSISKDDARYHEAGNRAT